MPTHDLLTSPQAWLVAIAITLACIVAARIWFPSLYAELVKWQIGIGAVLAFGGLIIAALYNADLNRQRDDRLRDEQSFALAMTLQAEIAASLGNLSSMRRTVGEFRQAIDRGEEAPFAARLSETLETPINIVIGQALERAGTVSPTAGVAIARYYYLFESLRQVTRITRSASSDNPVDAKVLDLLEMMIDRVADAGFDALDDLTAELLALGDRYGWEPETHSLKQPSPRPWPPELQEAETSQGGDE